MDTATSATHFTVHSMNAACNVIIIILYYVNLIYNFNFFLFVGLRPGTYLQKNPYKKRNIYYFVSALLELCRQLN